MSKVRKLAASLPKRSYVEVFRRFLPYLRPFRFSMVLIVTVEVGLIGLGLLEPWMTKPG